MISNDLEVICKTNGQEVKSDVVESSAKEMSNNYSGCTGSQKRSA